jgi:hypothetical protein
MTPLHHQLHRAVDAAFGAVDTDGNRVGHVESMRSAVRLVCGVDPLTDAPWDPAERTALAGHVMRLGVHLEVGP